MENNIFIPVNSNLRTHSTSTYDMKYYGFNSGFGPESEDYKFNNALGLIDPVSIIVEYRSKFFLPENVGISKVHDFVTSLAENKRGLLLCNKIGESIITAKFELRNIDKSFNMFLTFYEYDYINGIIYEFKYKPYYIRDLYKLLPLFNLNAKHRMIAKLYITIYKYLVLNEFMKLCRFRKIIKKLLDFDIDSSISYNDITMFRDSFMITKYNIFDDKVSCFKDKKLYENVDLYTLQHCKNKLANQNSNDIVKNVDISKVYYQDADYIYYSEKYYSNTRVFKKINNLWCYIYRRSDDIEYKNAIAEMRKRRKAFEDLSGTKMFELDFPS